MDTIDKVLNDLSERTRRLWEVKKIAKEISYVLLKRNEVSYTPEDITFSIYDIKNKDLGEFDYIKISVKYEPRKSIFDYKREIERKIFKKEYEICRASKIKTDIIEFLNEIKANNIEVVEEKLIIDKYQYIDLIDVEDYKLDKKFKTISLMLEDEKWNLIIRGNQVIIECSDIDDLEECEDCKIYSKEIDELNEIIKEKDELIDKLEKEKKEILDVVEKVYKNMARRLGVRV